MTKARQRARGGGDNLSLALSAHRSAGALQPRSGQRGVDVAPRQRQVLGRLHLGSRDTVRGNSCASGPSVYSCLGRHLGRHDQLDAAVVQHVDQPGEAARLAGQPRRHLRHVGQQHGVEARGELEVVVLRARPAAQRLEVEPDDAAGAPPRVQFAVLDVQHRVLVARLGQRARRPASSAASASAPSGVWYDLDLGQRQLPVVGAGVDVDDVEPAA